LEQYLTMRDRFIILFAVVFLIAAILIPLTGFGVGWYTWDATTGLYLAAGLFLGFVALGIFLLFQVEAQTWFTVLLPYFFGIIYTISPDLIPFGFDDAAVTATGSVLTYTLALRKDSRTPRWTILPLLLAAVYTAFGGFIPGGLDEIIANGIAMLIAGYGVNRATQDE
jgi:hypothetical protein